MRLLDSSTLPYRRMYVSCSSLKVQVGHSICLNPTESSTDVYIDTAGIPLSMFVVGTWHLEYPKKSHDTTV